MLEKNSEVQNDERDNDNTNTVTPTKKPSGTAIFAALFNGIGVGLLLGLLLGLAVSPVVSSIIATLSSLLAVLLGLNEKFLGTLKSLRIGAFGLSCVAGVLFGMFTRTHDLLSPQLESRKEQYIKLGYSEQEALDFISYQEFSLVPDHWTFVSTPENDSIAEEEVDYDTSKADVSKTSEAEPATLETDTKTPKTNKSTKKIVTSNAFQSRKSSVLFSSELKTTDCYLLDNVDESTEMPEIMISFEVVGGTWIELAKNLQKEMKSDALKTSLLICKKSFCEQGSSEKLTISNCEQLVNQKESNSMAISFEENGKPWVALISSARNTLSKHDFSKFLLSLSNTFCNETTTNNN
ncbi:MAG: hypothetical protein JXR03_03035 [Cyclobacteriaceae bacterium]